MDRLSYRTGTSDRSRWAVESRKEAIARGLNLLPAISLKFLTRESVIGLEECPPRAISQPCRVLGRPYDVGEKHRGEHTIELRGRPHARQELLDLVEGAVDVADVEEVVVAGKLDVLGSGEVRREVMAMPD